MKFNQLEYFVATVENGSLAEAAKKLYITPQAVSKAIGDLEQECGIDLIERVGRESHATLFGMKFYEFAAKALFYVNLLKDLASAENCAFPSGKERITLAIAASSDRVNLLSIDSLNNVLSGFGERAVVPIFDSSGSCLAAVEEDVADAAIVLGPAKKDGLRMKKLRMLSLGVLIAESHPLASRDFVSLQELSHYEIATPLDIRYCFPFLRQQFKARCLTPRFVHVPAGSEECFLRYSNGIIFVANQSEQTVRFDGACLKPLDEDEAMSVPIYFIEKEAQSSAMTRSLSSLIAVHAFGK